jgi:hypothetical protein
MRRISSKMTYWNKRIFPIIWFGVVTIVFAVGIAANSRSSPNALPFLLMPVVMLVVGYVIFKKVLFDLVDEVWDAGNALVVRNGGQEAQIPLSDIKNVGYTQFVNPPRITLSLRQPCVFGTSIAFSPPARFRFSFSPDPIVDELIDRIDAQRRRWR